MSRIYFMFLFFIILLLRIALTPARIFKLSSQERIFQSLSRYIRGTGYQEVPHVRPRRMYPWAFSRSFVVLLAAVHWHSPRQNVKSSIHCQGPPVLSPQWRLGAVTQFTYGNRHASPRRTPFPSLRVQRDFPSIPLFPPSYNAIYSRAFIISENELVNFRQAPPRFRHYISPEFLGYFFRLRCFDGC